MSKSEFKSRKHRSKERDCCSAQFECNFSGLDANLSISSARIVVSGLNGVRPPLGSCGCEKTSRCGKTCEVNACNKIQITSITTASGTVPILTILRNSGGLFTATIDVTGLTVGTAFTVTVVNPAVGCSGTFTGLVSA